MSSLSTGCSTALTDGGDPLRREKVRPLRGSSALGSSGQRSCECLNSGSLPNGRGGAGEQRKGSAWLAARSIGGSIERIRGRSAEQDLAEVQRGHVPAGHDVARHRVQIDQGTLDGACFKQTPAALGSKQ